MEISEYISKNNRQTLAKVHLDNLPWERFRGAECTWGEDVRVLLSNDRPESLWHTMDSHQVYSMDGECFLAINPHDRAGKMVWYPHPTEFAPLNMEGIKSRGEIRSNITNLFVVECSIYGLKLNKSEYFYFEFDWLNSCPLELW